jgi:hypothetical protein
MAERRWFQGLFSRFGRQPPAVTLSSEEVLRAEGSGQSESGVTGTENFGGTIKHDDPNPDWSNFQTALAKCDQMRRMDAQIRAVLQVIKLPLLSAKWQAVKADDGDDTDQQIADFVNKALFDDDSMSDSWDFTMRHILLMLDYGFSVLETVWRVDDEGYYRPARLAPRLPRTIRYWYTTRDGKLIGIVQYASVNDTTQEEVDKLGGAGHAMMAPALGRSHFQYLVIPADYAVVFSHEREGDNYEGTSILRSVWRNYFFKDLIYRLEAIRMERWGVGMPVAQIQENKSLTEGERLALIEILKKIRANEKAYAIMTDKVKLSILPEGSSSSGGSSGAPEMVSHHDQQIAMNVLATFLTMGNQPHGTKGFGSRLTDLFTSNLRGIANGVGSELKRQVVRRMCDLNFNMDGRQYPSVEVKDLDLSHLDSLIEALAQLTGTFLTPDDDTEAMLRKILQLPPLDPAFSRKARMQAQQTGAVGEGGGVVHEGVAGSAGGNTEAGTVVHEGLPSDGSVAHTGAPAQGGIVHDQPGSTGTVVHGA